jgi:hypothetical protein
MSDSQTIFIDSSRCPQNNGNGDVLVVLPTNSVTCDKDQSLKMSLKSMHFYYSWNCVNDQNNKIRFTNEYTELNEDITIPIGNRQLSWIAQYINDTTSPSISCVFVEDLNKFKIEFSGDYKYSVSFINKSWQILGFLETDYIQYTNSVTSTVPIEISPQKLLYISIMDVDTHGSSSIDNTSGYFRSSKILVSIPLQILPFDYNYFTPQDTAVSITLSEKYLQNFRITVTDDQNREILDMPRYLMSLQIEKVSNSSYIDRFEKKIETIIDFLRYSYIHATINDELLPDQPEYSQHLQEPRSDV